MHPAQLSGISAWLPWIVLALALLLLVVIVLAVVAVRRRAAPSAGATPKATAGPPAEWLAGIPVRQRLALALRGIRARIESLTGVGRQPYAVPWVALVDLGSSSAERLVAALPPSAIERDLPVVQPGVACRFRLLKDGVLVELDERVQADASREQRFREVVRVLRSDRPDRPVDGLVVCVPAAMLADAGAAAAADPQAAAGEEIYRLQWALQSLSGLRVPFYLLLTEAETLPGFSEFAAALPAESRREILGWSVPYALDTAFVAAWVDEGIASLVAGLSAMQARLLIEPRPTEEADRIFLLPARIAAMTNPLKRLLTAALRESAYHEAFLFRGFYLVGTSELAAADGRQPTPVLAAAGLFADRLFSEKIFAEFRLARPAQGALTHRRRAIRRTKVALTIAVVVAVFGVAAVANTRQRVASVGRLMNTIAAELARAKSPAQLSEQLRDAILVEGARAVLQAMSDVSTRDITSPLAPTSLLSSATERVEQAIARGYDTVVLAALWDGLEHRLREIVALPQLTNPQASSAAILRHDPVDHFVTAVDRLEEYDRFLSAFESLRESQDIDTLANLSEYVFAVPLPVQFRENYHLYRDALTKTARVPVRRHEIEKIAESGLRQMARRLFEARHRDNPLMQSAQRFIATFSELKTLPAGAAPLSLHERLARIRDDLSVIEAALSADAYGWLMRGDDAFAPSVERALAKLTTLSFVSRGDVSQLREDGLRQIIRARADAFALSYAPARTVLVRQQDKVVLAPELAATRSLLDQLLAQPFMAAGTPVAARGAGAALFWDPRTLSEAAAIVEGYLVRAAETAGRLPIEIERVVQVAQQTFVFRYIDDLIMRAALAGGAEPSGPWLSGNGLSDEATNFAAAARLLASIRDSLDVLGYTRAAERLRDAAGGQALRLLREIDAQLAAEQPYRPLDPSFGSWSGTGAFAAQSFGANSTADLAVLLSVRRSFIEQLARDYAQPLVQYLDGDGRARSARFDAQTSKWLLIIRALARYQQREPGNSVEVLEQFILADMDKIDLATCPQLTASAMPVADWFGEQLRELKRSIAQRCTAITRALVAEDYGRIRKAFNESLAGRFPFVGAFGNGAVRIDPANYPPADPNDIRRFFLSLGKTVETLRAPLRLRTAFGDGVRPAADFLEALLKVQDALAPMLADPGLEQPLVYELTPVFRTNPEREAGGDQIISWTLQAGDNRFESGQPLAPIPWTLGDPVALSIRWARNGPSVPVMPDSGTPEVEGMTARFAFADPWALFSMLSVQAPAPAEALGLPDRRAHVLQFEVPLRRNPEAALGGDADLPAARLYARLALTGVIRIPGQPDRRVPVTLPYFPAAAPPLPGEPSFDGVVLGGRG